MPRQVVANPYIKSTATTEPSLPSSPPKRSERRPLLSPIEVGIDDIFRAVSVIDLDADSDRAFNIDEDSAADNGAADEGAVVWVWSFPPSNTLTVSVTRRIRTACIINGAFLSLV